MDISIDHLASLARLALTEGEKSLYGSQLENILHYMETLNGLETSGIDPTSHVVSISNVMREDAVKPCLDRTDAMKNAPDRTDAFYRVPRIIE